MKIPILKIVSTVEGDLPLGKTITAQMMHGLAGLGRKLFKPDLDCEETVKTSSQ